MLTTKNVAIIAVAFLVLVLVIYYIWPTKKPYEDTLYGTWIGAVKFMGSIGVKVGMITFSDRLKELWIAHTGVKAPVVNKRYSIRKYNNPPNKDGH